MSDPCRDCKGSGSIVVDGYSLACNRCLDLPKIRPPLRWFRSDHGDDVRSANRGWFKPDPDSVLRWCFKHESSAKAPDDPCEHSAYFDPLTDCDVGWIAKPTRLETVE